MAQHISKERKMIHQSILVNANGTASTYENFTFKLSKALAEKLEVGSYYDVGCIEFMAASETAIRMTNLEKVEMN